MAWIERERLPSGALSWVVRWREGGKARKRRVRSNRAAKELAASVQHSEDVGAAWVAPVAERDRRATLYDMMRAYLEHQGRRCKPRTLSSMAVPLDLYRRRFGEGADPSVEVLTLASLEAWHDELRRSGRGGKPRSPATVRKYLAEVEGAWRWAWDRADDWPGIGPFRSLVRDLRVPVGETVVAPTWAEMDAAIAACRDVWVRRCAVVMRFTGLRISQVLRLQWSDVDMQAAVLKVRGELGKSRQEQRGRTLPISPHLVRELAGWGVREGNLVGVDLTDRRVENLVRNVDRRLREAWSQASARSEVWSGRPAHSFRKGVESGLLGQALPYIHVEAYLGHVVGRSEGATSGAAYVDAAALPLASVAAAFPELAVAELANRRRSWVRRVLVRGVG